MVYYAESRFSLGSFFRKLLTHLEPLLKYAGVYLLLSFVLGSLALMHTGIPLIMKIVQLLAFFVLGYIHASHIDNQGFFSRHYFIESALFSLLLALILSTALAGIYVLIGSDLRMAFASGSMFFIPYLLWHAWFFYKHIPRHPDLAWFKKDLEADELSQSFQNKISARFRVSDHYFELREKDYLLPISTSIKLGILFNQFLQAQNHTGESIEIKDGQDLPYGWQFFAESPSGLRCRQLNPEWNVRENKLSRTEIIAARRVHFVPAASAAASAIFEFEAW